MESGFQRWSDLERVIFKEEGILKRGFHRTKSSAKSSGWEPRRVGTEERPGFGYFQSHWKPQAAPCASRTYVGQKSGCVGCG